MARIILDNGNGLEDEILELNILYEELRNQSNVVNEAIRSLDSRVTALEDGGEEPPPPPPPGGGMWIDENEIQSGELDDPAWQNIMDWAVRDASNPNPGDQNDNTDAVVVAKALVAARTGAQGDFDAVINCLELVMQWDPQQNSNTNILSPCRNLAPYIIAADIISYRTPEFEDWIRNVMSTTFTGGGGDHTITQHHEIRPNNHGTHAGTSRLAAAIYLGDEEEIDRVAQLMNGWLGNRNAYSGYRWGDLDWQADPDNPVGVNPMGATLVIDGQPRNVDGVLPDDQRRQEEHGCPIISWPPCKENYVWEALQGIVAQALLLEVAGYWDVFDWEDQAILRAVRWLHEEADYPAEGDDSGTPYIINEVYGTDFPTPPTAHPGKNGLGITYPLIRRLI